MAKVRVYELARELNLDSKKLVEELLAGGMDIGNYMSTLDEQAAMRAREIVSGGVTEVVEEKRVKPTIIRRRKKRIEVEERVLEAKAAERLYQKPERSPFQRVRQR